MENFKFLDDMIKEHDPRKHYGRYVMQKDHEDLHKHDIVDVFVFPAEVLGNCMPIGQPYFEIRTIDGHSIRVQNLPRGYISILT